VFSQTTKEDFMKKLLIFAAVIAVVGSASAQDVMKVTLVKPESLTWKDNPALPKGAQSVTLLGDPTKAGEMVVTRTKLPATIEFRPALS
jgi:hypothetical protein